MDICHLPSLFALNICVIRLKSIQELPQAHDFSIKLFKSDRLLGLIIDKHPDYPIFRDPFLSVSHRKGVLTRS